MHRKITTWQQGIIMRIFLMMILVLFLSVTFKFQLHNDLEIQFADVAKRMC